MISRCYDEGNTSYRWYGAKGVRVCRRWRGDGGFERFLSDMGEPPSASHTIERIKNARGYGPGNCRWATAAEQARNTGQNRILRFAGRRWCLSDLAAAYGIGRSTLAYRLKRGWSIADAVLTPTQ